MEPEDRVPEDGRTPELTPRKGNKGSVIAILLVAAVTLFGYIQWQEANRNWSLVIVKLLYGAKDRSSMTYLASDIAENLEKADRKFGRVSEVDLIKWSGPEPLVPFECELRVTRNGKTYFETFSFGQQSIVGYGVRRGEGGGLDPDFSTDNRPEDQPKEFPMPQDFGQELLVQGRAS